MFKVHKFKKITNNKVVIPLHFYCCHTLPKRFSCFNTTVPFKILQKGLLNPKSISIKDTKDALNYNDLLQTTVNLKSKLLYFKVIMIIKLHKIKK